MANKQLTARVKFDTKSAEASLTRLSKKINNVQNAVNRITNKGTNKLSKNLNKATATVNKMNTAISKVATTTNKVATNVQKVRTATSQANQSAQRLGQGYQNANKSAGSLLKTVGKIAKTYLGIQTAKLAINASDTVTKTQNRLNALEGGSPEQTAESMDKIYAASQRSKSSYKDMLGNVSKTMTLAPDAFQGNIDNAIRFQEIMAKSYTLGGASDVEASTSMYQLVQALGSGTLQGDELRSVREGAPLAYKAIEKYAQGLLAAEEAERGLEVGALGSTESLKDLASQGVITSDMVVAAMMDAGEGIDEAFAKTKTTFEQTFNSIKNIGMKAFQPALESLNDILNSDAVRVIITVIGVALTVVGNVLSWVVNLFSILFNWIYNVATGSTVAGKIILSILAVIGIAMAVILFPKFIAWIQYMAFVIAYYTYLGAVALASGIKAMIGWMMANWVLLLIIVIIAAVVVAVIWLSDSFADACGIIVGAIMAAVAFVWNLFLSLVDLVLGVVNIFWNRFAAFANFFANVFSDPIGAIIHAFGDMADGVLGILETIASAIDKLFGSHLADSVSKWRGSLDAKVEAAAKKHGNGKYEEKVAKANLTSESLGLERWAYTDAYNTGYKWGEAGGNWITDKLSGLGNMLTGGGLPDPNADQYAVNGNYNPNEDEILGKLSGIEENTDEMELSKDDLDYLRRLADMEWKKEFTTASIKVDMTNNNNVQSERDLDGIVAYLADTLREEMTIVADGVHY